MPPVPTTGSVSAASVEIASFVRQEPAWTALVGFTVLVGVYGLVRLYRWYTRSPGDRLRRLLASYPEVTVLLHPNPDPDAMAAALGVKFVAESVDTAVELRYAGEIRHPENRAFRTVLGIGLEPLESVEDLGTAPIVLVDHNEPRGFAGCERVRPVAVIDHHPGDGIGMEFTDVRPDYGATATVLAEYLRSIGAVPVDPETPVDAASTSFPIPWEIATGLLYGILSDTNDLTRGSTPAEFEASAYLSPGVDEEALDRIANPQVGAEILDVTARAISQRQVRGSFAVSDVGRITNVDAIPRAADELLLLEGVTAVVVYGHKDDTLHLSGRSLDDRVHVGETLESIAEGIPRSGGGGHARMGGGQLSLPHLQEHRSESGLTRVSLTDQLLDALAGYR